MITYWRECYKRQPRPVRRLLWWWIIPFAWMGVWIAWSIWRPIPRPFGWFGAVLDPLGMVAGQFITLGIVTSKVRRIKRDFNTSGGRLCTQCGHSLAGLPDSGLCPECGHRFDIELDRLAWRDVEIVLAKKA